MFILKEWKCKTRHIRIVCVCFQTHNTHNYSLTHTHLVPWLVQIGVENHRLDYVESFQISQLLPSYICQKNNKMLRLIWTNQFSNQYWHTMYSCRFNIFFGPKFLLDLHISTRAITHKISNWLKQQVQKRN